MNRRGSRKFSRLSSNEEDDSEQFDGVWRDDQERPAGPDDVAKKSLCTGSPAGRGKRMLQSLSCKGSPRSVNHDVLNDESTSSPRHLEDTTMMESIPQDYAAARDPMSPSRKVKPTYDSKHKIFSIPEGDEPAAEDEEEQIPNDLGEGSTGSTAILVESYSEVEALIARVKRLDELVKAGDDMEATTGSTDQDDEEEVEEKSSTGGSPAYFQPIDDSGHDHAMDDHAAELLSDTAKELTDDDSHDFQVIYRRSSPSTSRAPTAVSSSVASFSSFGITGLASIHKPLPISPPSCASSVKQLTAHPFFWRTHPRETFISYGPNRPKTLLSPLTDGLKSTTSGQKSISGSVSSRIRAPLMQESPKSTFWSKSVDPVGGGQRPRVMNGCSQLDATTPRSGAIATVLADWPETKYSLSEGSQPLSSPGSSWAIATFSNAS